jgi:hypothetical protein
MTLTDTQRAQRLDKQVKQLNLTLQTSLATIATLTDLMGRATPASGDAAAWSPAIDAANSFHAGTVPRSDS